MNRRQAESASLPIPTAMRVGEAPFVRHHAVDRRRHQNSDKTAADPHQPADRGLVARDQSTQIVARNAHIGVTDHSAQAKSP
jgi:hypothetical protein